MLKDTVLGADGYIWYRLAEGGWVRADVIEVHPSREAAETAAASGQWLCNPSPTEVPPASDNDSQQADPGNTGNPAPGESSGSSGDSGGGGSGGGAEPPPTEEPPPPQNYSVTIVNNTSCNASGSLGPAGFSVGAGGSTTVQVPGGSHGFSANAGSCGSTSAQYNISGNAQITLSN